MSRDRLRELVERFDPPLDDVKLWRLSADRERPVLRRLPWLDAELGDRDSHEHERDPLAEVRAELVTTFDTGPAPESEWWEHAYPGGPMVGPAWPRNLYPPDAAPGHAPSADGLDIEAARRAISRGGRAPWSWATGDNRRKMSNTFAHGGAGGNVGDSGVAGFQRQMRITPASGYIGKAAGGTANAIRSARIPDELPHGGEPLLDACAVHLLEQAVQQASRPAAGDDEVRDAIADYCRRTLNAAPAWHYRQARAMQSLGDNPDAGGYSDCSEHATCSYYHARKQTGVAVPDPNHSGFNGYGYTGTLVDNPRASSPYKVGDLAIYGQSTGSTEHVCTCYLAGDASSSEWCSHGSEQAPYAVELHYRGDLLCVVRPPLMP